MKKQATVKDIARAAGVSITTVSLALRGKDANRISSATCEKVLAIAKTLNYQPNFAARSLVNKQSNIIGLLIKTLLNPFYSELAQDIIGRAQERGYRVITCSVEDGVDNHKAEIRELISHGVDGLIVCAALLDDKFVFELIDSGLPVALAMRYVQDQLGSPAVDFVGIDNPRGAYLAIEHLVKMGHRKIALMVGPKNTSTGQDRLQGAQVCFDTYGIDFDSRLVVEGDFSRRSGHELTRGLIGKGNEFTAIFTTNDHMALGVLDALQEAGLRVPQDVAVVGFDDIEMAGLPGVGLTTVSQKKTVMGRTVVDVLVSKIKMESVETVRRVVLEPKLIIRDTCGFKARESRYDQILPVRESV
ncbi:MAG: LacI family transcriptional regulator [Proteobacteria bacterium]|nr:LacI family transcriptional regulator [Pseudomonadota bacterium]MBU1452451.1 LacI family transcriptional regulator [Pseudomonadota bacterium]MBU2467718.1 LacI family transcriptional regulator [Pseudomonadota bacterium]MBU2518270.1 LacI family transcriptional regulator [Pseudomonadota bacterium]